MQNVSERTVMNYLKELCRSRLLRKSKAGHYEKIIYDKSGKFSYISKFHILISYKLTIYIVMCFYQGTN